MFHIVYKTVNKVNNKYYYGVHSTNNLEDDYLGSGTNLIRAIKKYGRQSFERSIICVFDDRDHALMYEKSLVNISMLEDINCYNIVEGGGTPPPRTGKVAPATLLRGKNRTEKQKEASKTHSRKMKGRKAYNRQKTILFGVEFDSLTQGLKHFGLSPSQYYYMKANPDMSFETAELLKEHTWAVRNQKISDKRRQRKDSKEIKQMLGYSRIGSNRNKY